MDRVNTVKILGITITLLEFDEAVALMENLIREKESKFVALVNANTLNYAYLTRRYSEILTNADLVLRDGTGIKWAIKKRREDPKYNFVGTDFIPDFCNVTSKKKYKLYLLGARPGVAESAGKALCRVATGTVVTGFHHGYFDRQKEKDIIRQINILSPDILLVAMGNPKQEIWISENLHKLKVPVCIGVGALFDYLSGNVRRAPKWMLNAGFEWFYRFLIEPKRLWRRYLVGNPVFILRVYREFLLENRDRKKKRACTT
jgi:N-acetylglucosaminyldiphosphoundecaprenol N-acetyl-beta-D-mannosaminyltransferase